MSEGNGNPAPYIECEGCVGRGIVKVRIDAETRLIHGIKDPEQKLAVVPHGRCDGAGILILRHTGRDGAPYYGRPRLS